MSIGLILDEWNNEERRKRKKRNTKYKINDVLVEHNTNTMLDIKSIIETGLFLCESIFV